MQFLINFAANFVALAILGYAIATLGVVVFVSLCTIPILLGYAKPDPDLKEFIRESLTIWYMEKGLLTSSILITALFAFAGAAAVFSSADPSENMISFLFR